MLKQITLDLLKPKIAKHVTKSGDHVPCQVEKAVSTFYTGLESGARFDNLAQERSHGSPRWLKSLC